MSTRVVTQDDGRSPKSQNCSILQHTLPDHEIKLSNVGIKINASLYIWRPYCVKVEVDASNYLQTLQWIVEQSKASLNVVMFNFLVNSYRHFPTIFRRNCRLETAAKKLGHASLHQQFSPKILISHCCNSNERTFVAALLG